MDCKKINIYVICFVLLIMDYSKSWFTISVLHGGMSIVALFTFVIFFIIYKERKPLTGTAVLFYAVLSAGYIIAYRADTKWVVISILKNLPLLTLFMLKKEDLSLLAANIVKCFSFIISISICLFFLKQIGFHLPIFEHTVYNQYEIINYYYFYADAVRYGIKFSGIALEPGFFSVLCISMLTLNEFDFKKKSSYVFVLAILCSLSLEGYVLLVLGYAFFSFSKGENIRYAITYLVLAVFVIVFLVIYVLNYEGGNNIIAQTVFERMMFDKELGIVGNNRENDLGEQVLDMYFYSDNVWWGIGQEKLSRVSNIDGLDMCSWRVFVVTYGAIYTFICLIGIFILFIYTRMRKTFPVFLLFLLDFYPHGDMYSETLVVLVITFLFYVKERNADFLSLSNIKL